MFEIGKKYRFYITKENQQTVYTGTIISIEKDLISIKDKFGIQVGFKIDMIKEYREVNQ